jgi:hypothetical protein
MKKLPIPFTLLLAALLLLAIGALGQDGLGRRQPSVALAPVVPVWIVPGRTARVTIAFRVDAGYHINSNRPHSDLLLATLLKLETPANLTVEKLVYPAGEDREFEFLPGEKLNVYTGDFAVTATLAAAPALAAGSYRVTGTLRYQACDNRQCYAPRNLPVSFEVMVAGKK